MKINLIHLSFYIFALFLATPIKAIELYSRNMPRTCSFVYEVNSDLFVVSGRELNKSSILHWATYNVYDAEGDNLPWEWQETPIQAEWSQTQQQWVFQWTFKSFATSERRLNRHVLFFIDPMDTSHEETPIYFAEFGREFGESCFRGGRKETPWRKRQLQIYRNED